MNHSLARPPAPWYWPSSDLGRAGIIAGAAVLAVALFVIGGQLVAKPRTWTHDGLHDRFVMGPMDDIEPVLGRADHAVVDAYGNISVLTYRAVPASDGRSRPAFFFGRGGRCYDAGFEGR